MIRSAVLCCALLAAGAVAEPVRFALDAPHARSVHLAGEMTDWEAGKRAMTRGPDGRWSLTLDLAPGQWVYKFVVDGQWIADPKAGRDADGRGGEHSFVFVGEGDWQPLPPGPPRSRIETHALPSAALGGSRKTHVILPPGFAQGDALPVLLLLHGGDMDADQWLRTGHIQHYVDRLRARGELQPLVLVLPSGGPEPYTGASEQHLMQELLPWLKAHYGLEPGRAQLGVAGMSMGARGALHLAQAHPQRFGFAYGLSGSFHGPQIEAIHGWPRGTPLALRCGREDFVFPRHQALVRALQRTDIRFEHQDEPGGHTWHYWSRTSSDMLRWIDRQFSALRAQR